MMTRTTTNWTNNYEQWRDCQNNKKQTPFWFCSFLFVQFVVVRSAQDCSHSTVLGVFCGAAKTRTA